MLIGLLSSGWLHKESGIFVLNQSMTNVKALHPAGTGVTWEVSRSGVVSVAADGSLTIEGPGITMIVGESQEGARCIIIVYVVPNQTTLTVTTEKDVANYKIYDSYQRMRDGGPVSYMRIGYHPDIWGYDSLGALFAPFNELEGIHSWFEGTNGEQLIPLQTTTPNAPGYVDPADIPPFPLAHVTDSAFMEELTSSAALTVSGLELTLEFGPDIDVSELFTFVVYDKPVADGDPPEYAVMTPGFGISISTTSSEVIATVPYRTKPPRGSWSLASQEEVFWPDPNEEDTEQPVGTYRIVVCDPWDSWWVMLNGGGLPGSNSAVSGSGNANLIAGGIDETTAAGDGRPV